MKLPHLTEEQFRANTEWVMGLREFLQSEPGQATLSVLAGHHPLRQLADSRVTRGGNNIRAVAAAEAEGERAASILGRLEGYETVLELLTHTLLQVAVRPAKHSKKAGRDIPPAPPPSA